MVKRNTHTSQGKEFRQAIDMAKKEVDSWPEWKKIQENIMPIKLVKPKEPLKPIPPSKTSNKKVSFSSYHNTIASVLSQICTDHNFATGHTDSVEDLLKSGFFDRVNVCVESESYSDDYVVYIYWNEEQTSKSYESEYKKYEKKLEKYNKDIISYDKKLREYNLKSKDASIVKERELYENLKKKFEG